MNRHLMVAIVEDDKGRIYQFQSFNDEDLNTKIAAWVRPRWREDFGNCPEDDGDCLEVYFENMSGPPFVAPGFEHTLKVIDPIDLSELLASAGGGHSPGPWSEDPEGERAVTIEDADGVPICDVYLDGPDGKGISPEAARANIELIVSAPLLGNQIRQLTRWKEEALAVMPDFQEIGKVLGLPIGSDVSKLLIPEIRKLNERRVYRPATAVELEEILRVIDKWRYSRTRTKHLHDALGWTREQCAKWADTGWVPVGYTVPAEPRQSAGTYPMELYINGELSFKLDSEDAEGDLKAIRALMEIRTRARQNKPLTNRELYGVDDPHQVIYRDASGKETVIPGESDSSAGHSEPGGQD
jgi:hypothetical protein